MPDAHVVDAHPDAPLDAPEPVAGHYHYAISKQQWPTSSSEARADGFDIDGNSTIDNQFGDAMATLIGMGFDVQTQTDVAIAHGSEIMLADLGADDLGSAGSASFAIYAGENPDPAPCNGSLPIRRAGATCKARAALRFRSRARAISR